MSSWYGHHATGVHGDCCAGDCSPGDRCCWNGPGCPSSPAFNRFVSVGSVRYGVRVGAVSPPPPGVRYRSGVGPGGAAATVGLLHHRHRRRRHGHDSTDEDCCCSVVNLPWPRSVASVSRIPLLADKQQLPINSSGIFSSVNSVDMSNGSAAGCISIPSLEHDCEPEREREYEHVEQSETDVKVVQSELTTVYRSRPSWSHPPQYGLSGCVADTDQVRGSPSASQFRLQTQLRRRVLVRSRSDATAYETPGGPVSTTINNTNGSDVAAARRATLDRLHRFRFGGNRANLKNKKTTDDKVERLRELTDRLKNVTSSSTPSSTSHKHVTQQPHHHHHQQQQQQQQQYRKSTDEDATVAADAVLAVGPVPPPRTRHAQHQHSTPSTPTSTSTPTPTSTPTTGTASVAVLPSSTIATDEISCVDVQLPKAEARPVIGSYIQRTIPFRSASFSQVDFSTSDGKYFRRRNVDSNDNRGNGSRNDTINGASLTLPRKRDNQLRNNNSVTLNHQNRSPAEDEITDAQMNKLFDMINQEANSLQSVVAEKGGNGLSTPSEVASKNEAGETVLDPQTDDSRTSHGRTSSDGIDTNNSTTHPNIEERKRDRSRRRKGMYISQWPDHRASVMLAYAQEKEMPSFTDEYTQVMKPNANECCFEEKSSYSIDEPVTPEDVPKRFEWNSKLNSVVLNVEEKNGSSGKTQTNKSYNLGRTDSLSEGENDLSERRPSTPGREHPTSPILSPSDVSDTENRASVGNDSLSPHAPRRYSKRPLRGPYGQMLEAEMKRPDATKIFSKHQYGNELKFLDDLSGNAVPQRSSNPSIAASMVSLPSSNSANLVEPKPRFVLRSRGASNHSLDDSTLRSNTNVAIVPRQLATPTSSPVRKISSDVSSSTSAATPVFGEIDSGQHRLFACHQRTASSPSKLEEIPIPNQSGRSASAEPSTEFLRELLRGSSEQLTVTSNTETGSGPVPSTLNLDTVMLIMSGYNNIRDCLHLRLNDMSPDNTVPVALPNHLSEDSEDEQLYYRCVPKFPEFELTSTILDTRTHIVVELYETERSYVESLQILVMKYLEPLKSAENSCLLDAALVDEIFYQVPALLSHHQVFLEELRKRLEHWDVKQKIGDLFLDFTKPAVVEAYTAFINNWKRAKEVIKTTCQAKPAFTRFLEAMAREHKGKLALDSLLIKPIQKFPKYELLIQRLIKHTDPSHPDYSLLLEAQKEIHENLIKINCTERETVEFEQQQQNLKELESLVEGLVNLVTADRTYLRHDLVTMTAGQGTRKERALFLFSDLLVITSIKRRSGTIRKPTGNCPGSVTSTLDANKYKLLMRIPLEDLEIMKAKDENVRRVMLEIENLTEDISVLNQISELTWSLHCSHGQLEEIVREMLTSLNRQLMEQQNSDSQLSYLDLTINTPNGVENLSVVFSQPEKRASWEESFNDAKHKLAMSVDRRPSPEFLAPVPIRKTRAGLQFTCAAPTLTSASNVSRDVWVCNSDGYVGQVCVLSLYPEPTVTSCNGVCNARILCVASVPAATTNLSITCSRSGSRKVAAVTEDDENKSANIQLDSSSSSADEEDSEREEYIENRRRGTPVNRGKSAETASTDSSDDTDNQQPTMWLGTEDGCIHIYNCTDNIRIKKNKIRLQHGSSILCIMYLDNRVFVSMANGDITIYARDHVGGWNTSSPLTVSVGTAMMPVSKMLPNSGKLWCSCSNTIKIFNIHSLTVEHTFQTNGDQNKSIMCMVMSGLGVWLSLHNSAVIKCFHSITHDFLCEINVAPAVTKMLTSCDDIIRQHKAACLRVTSLLACKDLLWIGTSAGVLLTMPLPHITTSTTKISMMPSITGVPHGHTGHVRFLTCMESAASGPDTTAQSYNYGSMSDTSNVSSKLLVISGGDGYEDFRSSNMSEVAGREDSTNHLLLWHV